MFFDLDKKRELKPKVRFIVDKNRYNENGLLQDMKDALKTFKLIDETKEDMYKCTFWDYTSKRKFNRHEKTMHYYYE